MRPALNDAYLNLKLPSVVADGLEAMARASLTTKSEVVRQLLVQALRKEGLLRAA